MLGILEVVINAVINAVVISAESLRCGRDTA